MCAIRNVRAPAWNWRLHGFRSPSAGNWISEILPPSPPGYNDRSARTSESCFRQSFQFWNWLSHLTCGETRSTATAKYKSYTLAEFDWNRNRVWPKQMTCDRTLDRETFLETGSFLRIYIVRLLHHHVKFHSESFINTIVVQTYSNVRLFCNFFFFFLLTVLHFCVEHVIPDILIISLIPDLS